MLLNPSWMAKSTFASVYLPKMPRRGFHSFGRAPALGKAARKAAAVADPSKARRLRFPFSIRVLPLGATVSSLSSLTSQVPIAPCSSATSDNHLVTSFIHEHYICPRVPGAYD